MLSAQSVSYIRGSATLLQDANVTVAKGEILAVLGPNGAGKSTLLRVLAGDLHASRGSVELNGRAIEAWSATELARQRAVLPQSESLRFAFAAHEVVRLGRYPWGERSDRHAEQIVAAALDSTGVAHLAPRPYTELSAGERARVQLARVLAQLWEPMDERGRFLLLDEPTANLDLTHQQQVLATLRRFSRAGAGIVLVLHDLNLALQFANRVLLLKEGRIAEHGPARETLTAPRITDVFGVNVEILRLADGTPWIATSARSHSCSRSR